MNRLNLNKFLTTFSQVWNDAVIHNKEAIESAYGKAENWTAFMLGSDGVISRIAELLSKEMPMKNATEWYKLGALFVSGEDLFRSDLTYPSEVQAIIEHENGDNVEEEMWKLLHWRSSKWASTSQRKLRELTSYENGKR